jgi:ABC-type phosphate/phosphonate transport system substrate-binding protein
VSRPLLIGAVVYDPKVVTIWEIIQDYFLDKGLETDTVFYTNYELQVEALRQGQIDIAWNSPLAWLDSVRAMNGACRAISMRDTDQDRETMILVRKDSDIQTLQDLAGRKVAVGAKDSPQATLIPLGMLHEAGVAVEPMRHDVLVGKHGDHVGGERDALEALRDGKADASCALDLNWELWSSDGTADPAEFRVLAKTPKFDHCVFTVPASMDAEVERGWLDVLHSMDYSNPDHQRMMDMEGLKEWRPGRTSGFGPLQRACDAFGFFEAGA